jgi:hypothetical protein
MEADKLTINRLDQQTCRMLGKVAQIEQSIQQSTIFAEKLLDDIIKLSGQTILPPPVC